MASVEIRPGVIMAYDDYCFAEPWTSPQTIVAVHGNAESARAWTCWVPFLAGQYHLVLPDMPGFGRSAAPPAYHWQVAEIAGDFGRFLDAAKIERCHLMGAKYGGSVVTQFAIDHSDRLLSLSLFGSPVRGSGSGNADKIRDLGVRGWAQATMLVPMISHSPVVFWLLPVFGLRGTGYFLATTETIFGVLIFLGYWSPRLGILGALGSIVTYIGTTTIMLFLPGAWAQEAGGFPIFTLPMGFLMKDVLFLVASFYLLKQDLTRAVLEITRS